MCMAEPTCRLFVGDSLCCLGYGIVQHADVRLWLVCNADVYLPEPKCLTVTDVASGQVIPPADPAFPDPLNALNATTTATPNARSEELLVELPLAYYVPPVSRTPGELRVSLDFEQTRLTFTDGLCSLRLRRPCEWEGALYESVTAVAPVQLLSVLSANETEDAAQLVRDQLGTGQLLQGQEAEQTPASKRRRLRQELLLGAGAAELDPMTAQGEAALLMTGGEDAELAAALAAPDLFALDGDASSERRRQLITVVGGELPTPQVDEAALPPLTDVLSLEYLQTDLATEDYFISWTPSNTTAGELCQMTNAGDLPEGFLLGNFEDLVGYEEECTPESLPEVGGVEQAMF